MFSMFTSSATTAVLFLAMAGYLIRGKYSSGTLFPKVLIAFAILILFQGGVALAARLVRLRRGAPCHLPRRLAMAGQTFDGAFPEAAELLAERRFIRAGEDRQGTVACLAKGVRKGLVCESVAYGALLATLVLGLLNYGFSIRGYFTVAPGGEWAGLQQNVQLLQRGFMADMSALDYKIKGVDLTSAGAGAPSTITLLALDGNGKETASPRLRSGDTYDLGRVRMLYLGDGYLAFLVVMKGDHDFLPRPLYLSRRKGDKKGGYRGKLEMSEPGASGEVELDPVARRFNVKVVKEGKTEYDGSFAFENAGRQSGGRQGEFQVSVTSLGHFGRFDIMRHTYRNEIFAGLAALVAALLARALNRPQRVWLWADGGNCLFHTRSRSLRKALAGGGGAKAPPSPNVPGGS